MRARSIRWTVLTGRGLPLLRKDKPSARAFRATSLSDRVPVAYHSNSRAISGANSGSGSMSLLPFGPATLR